MNRTVKELQLFRHLTLTPSNLINIVFGLLNTLIAAAISAGWQRWLFIFIVMIFLLTCSPDFRDYQALNLNRRYWARHKQRLVVGPWVGHARDDRGGGGCVLDRDRLDSGRLRAGGPGLPTGVVTESS